VADPPETLVFTEEDWLLDIPATAYRSHPFERVKVASVFFEKILKCGGHIGWPSRKTATVSYN
jgi:hypothetical protein